MSRGTVLFVDDEKELRESAREWLAVVGFSASAAANGEEALARLGESPVDVLVTDVRMPGMDGLELLAAASIRDPLMPVVLLTGHGDVALSVEAMRRGAHDFLEKPYDADHLVAVLDRAVRERRRSRELERLRGAAGGDMESRLVGTAPAMAALRERIRQLADVDVDVLIVGETGAGKEVVARALHDFGKRRERPFVALNCAAIPESVFESEIFGHERGAFTGAVQKRVGRIEFARGGTVLLDEIESMPLALQAKLLRVIQERVVEPVGSNRQTPVDVRFLAATKVDLKAESEAGRFRSDLYYRLATVALTIPALGERPGDVALLFRHFCAGAAERHGVALPPTPPALLDALGARRWQGNVRELKAAAERHVLGLPAVAEFEMRGDAPERGGGTLPERVAAFEAELIRQALDGHDGNAQAASQALGIPRRTLSEKMARYGLRRGDLDATG
ncbi:sigma-54-dependent Fis family transcriptional regulator [Nitratireductor mangrovi]|uniref:Sigma-54-dependent Fis family transcriptional regulator n=1 Tax=Nitratireductor mangrovi TaxID=2599600 RepID=A0A5B8KYQ2_9HYPH|nr:sigma-54 dependent transcriptional regulator [Nitratireductor mangrovi]QDZ00666.1 sigma-54-dependent Fis family transcriptional regulator [Nitratireductor mangrovi]